MDGYKLGVVETHFAELIWQHEPLTSGELVKLCEQELQWKKSTTYTVLKKLCEHGIFQNENGTVTSLLSQEAITPYRARNLWRTPSMVLFPRFWRLLPPGNLFRRRTLRKFSA